MDKSKKQSLEQRKLSALKILERWEQIEKERTIYKELKKENKNDELSENQD